MNWKKLKIGGKLSLAFGVISVILFIVGTWSIVNISGIVNNAETVIKGNELRADLELRNVEHLKWAAELAHFINDLETTELEIETDQHKCDFGKWYYGEGRKNDEELAPALRPIFDELEQPHKNLHASAIKIKESLTKNVRMYSDSTMSEIFRQQYTANNIFFIETEVYLKEMGEIFGKAAQKSKEEIITDEELINRAGISKQVIIILSLVALVVSIVLAIVITRNITIPLKAGLDFALKISKGDLTSTVKCNTNDEIGQLCNALSSMAAHLRSIVTEILVGAKNIETASNEVNMSSRKISQGASEQASSTEEVSASMEEMTANISQNTLNAKETETITIGAVNDIKESNKSTELAVKSMKQIADKIQIINDIAFQTNILALNAAVEAARAGEHGKGFAVVATEVRKFAERSKIAAEEINTLTVSGVQVSEKAGQQLANLVPEIEKTAGLVANITVGSIEQDAGAEQINNAINSLNTITQHNAAASEEMASGSEELASQAEQLRQLISFFKVDTKFEVFK